jgi:hypothetical protein
MKSVVTFTILFILIISTSCSKTCETANPDLIALIYPKGTNPSAKTGVPFVWQEVIKNILTNDDIQCVVDAPASESGYNVQYRPTPTSAWQTNTEALHSIGSIKGGSEIVSNPSFTFLASGEYRVFLMADSTKKVTERSESNNYSGYNGAVTRSATAQSQNFVIIKVVPSDEFPNNPAIVPPVIIKFY